MRGPKIYWICGQKIKYTTFFNSLRKSIITSTTGRVGDNLFNEHFVQKFLLRFDDVFKRIRFSYHRSNLATFNLPNEILKNNVILEGASDKGEIFQV
jgi:hypothetical protein